MNLEKTVWIVTLTWSLPTFAIVVLSLMAPFLRDSWRRGAHRSVDKLIAHTESRGVAEIVVLLREVLRRRGGAP